MRTELCGMGGRSKDPLEVLPDPAKIDGIMQIQRGRVWNWKRITSHNFVMSELADRLIVGNSRDILAECIS
jgi:hypothetical protein